MAEKIYSIRIREAFSAKCGCPVCALRAQLEEEEADRILGASMMEPDIREETNRRGFCKSHLNQLLSRGSKLPLALTLSTHLVFLENRLFAKTTAPLSKTPDGKKLMEAYGEAKKSCYLCARINLFLGRVLENLCYLYETEEAFAGLFAEQEYFCKTHSLKLLETAEKSLDKKKRAALAGQLAACNRRYLKTLREDLDWFCKKFDYRYEKEPWKNAKDAPERAAKFLS